MSGGREHPGGVDREGRSRLFGGAADFAVAADVGHRAEAPRRWIRPTEADRNSRRGVEQLGARRGRPVHGPPRSVSAEFRGLTTPTSTSQSRPREARCSCEPRGRRASRVLRGGADLPLLSLSDAADHHFRYAVVTWRLEMTSSRRMSRPTKTASAIPGRGIHPCARARSDGPTAATFRLRH